MQEGQQEYGHPPFDMSDSADRDRALATVLDWYLAVGVDGAVAGEPTDWIERGPVAPQRYVGAPKATVAEMRQQGGGATRPAPAAATTSSERRAPEVAQHTPTAARPPTTTATSSVTLSDDEATAHARSAARAAQSLDELKAALLAFDGCGLKRTAKNLCFYRGAQQARVMLIGDVPRAEEDRAGVPFVGPLGELLDKMLKSIGLSEADTHITQSVYWRPPGNRRPTPQEILICRAFLERQIRLVQPEFIVTCGGDAAKAVLGTTKSILKVRGKWTTLELAASDGEAAAQFPVLPTLHPDYLMTSPLHKRHAWKDLLALKIRLDGVDTAQ